MRCGTRRTGAVGTSPVLGASGRRAGWFCTDRAACELARATFLRSESTRMEEIDGRFFRVTALPDATRR
jgi:hypothetical protein